MQPHAGPGPGAHPAGGAHPPWPSHVSLVVERRPRTARRAAARAPPRGPRGGPRRQDGLEAMAEVQDAPPDLVVLDMMMPGMDGLRGAPASPDGVDVPVLMLTARTRCPTALPGSTSVPTTTSSSPSPSRSSWLVSERAPALAGRPPATPRCSGSSPSSSTRGGAAPPRRPPDRADAHRVRGARPRSVPGRGQVLTREMHERVWGLRVETRFGPRRLRRLPVAEARGRGEPRMLDTVHGVGYVLRTAPA